MLLAVRHGHTALNGQGRSERSRGWLPVHLTPEGRAAAQEAAQKLSSLKGTVTGPVYSSDLPRAVQSAAPIAQALGLDASHVPDLRDWHIGDLAGQPLASVLPQLRTLVQHPDSIPQNGEPYRAFMGRVMPLLKQLVESPKVHVAVSHNRVLTLLHALSKGQGKTPDPKTLDSKGPVEPGGVLLVHPNWQSEVWHS